MKRRTLGIFLLLLTVAAPLFAWPFSGPSERTWRKDVKKQAGTLTEEEWGIAEFTRDTLMATWDKEWKELSKEEYRELVDRSAEAAKDKKAMIFWKMGEAGEKGLKALIVLAEDFARAAGEAVDEKAAEYDRRHGTQKKGKK